MLGLNHVNAKTLGCSDHRHEREPKGPSEIAGRASHRLTSFAPTDDPGDVVIS